MDRAMQVSRCETVADVLALLEDRDGWAEPWQTFFAGLLDASGLSYSRFASRCGLSKNTVKRWRMQGGAPKSRDTYVKIGFGAAMPPQAVSDMLSRYGGYCGLNPRDSFDACCIFCLQRRARGDTRYDYAAAEAMYHRLLTGQPSNGPSSITTTKLMAHLSAVDTEAEFAAFLQEFGTELTGRKQKLERYLADYLTVHQLEAARDGGGSLHSLGLPAWVEKQLSQLRRHGIVPRRRSLTALGLHLNMTLEELDVMLHYAGMDPLRARDRLECVLIYALQQLALTHPELALGNATALLAVTRDAATRRRCTELAQEYWQAGYQSEAEDVESVAGYVRCVLEELDLEEADELLGLL
ncbi:hypothetical protein [Agathobaculum sp. Marseille-P7918]|uniref:hypothetical protein n=1 Tax=Agathobaculum sp. Marseille-P7918 TaxID=2479843 RepID=UPI000F63F982|nr:hypothetical protein [Agathobaculum sp. Marseille-P7918]